MVKRGDLYWADLVPRSGSEQSGRRPVLLISHDGFNQSLNWQSLIVIPVTTQMKRQGPTTVYLPVGTGSLNRESLALGHQITTLDRTKIADRIGSLPATLLAQVEQAVLNAVSIKIPHK